MAIETSIDTYGRLDLLCNNAAVHPLELIEEHALETWHETFRVNVDGTMLCSQLALPHMKRQHSGAIVNSSGEPIEQVPTHIPVGRYGKPADVAYMLSYLASEAASYITGSVIVLDGDVRRGRG